MGKSKRRKAIYRGVGKNTLREKPPTDFRRVRKLSKVLAETRERQKGRLLKSQEEIMAILRKG